jgi:succinate dehydrogenase / fumarate reductase cytochrome b subunit
MSTLKSFYASTIGKKIVVAVTGLILVGFVIGHMMGNLKTFMGQAKDGRWALDHYAEFLRTMGADFAGPETLLWVVRIVLLIALVLHVATVIQLSIRNRCAKPIGYAHPKYRASTYAARSMALGGFLIFCFVIFHILHFTTGDLHSDFRHGEVYRNVYTAFQQGGFVVIYAAAMFALGLHLFHGTWSVFQTLGIDNPDRNASLRCIAKLLAIVVPLGFVAVPLAIFFQFVPSPL